VQGVAVLDDVVHDAVGKVEHVASALSNLLPLLVVVRPISAWLNGTTRATTPEGM